MAYNWHQGAKRCLKKLFREFERIRTDYIDKGDYTRAKIEWACRVEEIHLEVYEPYILEIFPTGITILACAEGLQKTLEEKNKHRIEFFTKMFLAGIRQGELKLQTKGLESKIENSPAL